MKKQDKLFAFSSSYYLTRDSGFLFVPVLVFLECSTSVSIVLTQCHRSDPISSLLSIWNPTQVLDFYLCLGPRFDFPVVAIDA